MFSLLLQADPDVDPRPFTFDYSYWSHDGGKELDTGGQVVTT